MNSSRHLTATLISASALIAAAGAASAQTGWQHPPIQGGQQSQQSVAPWQFQPGQQYHSSGMQYQPGQQFQPGMQYQPSPQVQAGGMQYYPGQPYQLGPQFQPGQQFQTGGMPYQGQQQLYPGAQFQPQFDPGQRYVFQGQPPQGWQPQQQQAQVQQGQPQQVWRQQERRVRELLERAGFQDVTLVDAAFLVRAQTSDGNSTLMLINPPLLPKVAAGVQSGTAAEGASMGTGGRGGDAASNPASSD